MQSTMRPIDQSLALLLLRAREQVMLQFRPLFRRYDLTEQQWRVIRVLREFEQCDVTALAEQSCLLMPSLTRIVRQLVERGLVTRQSDAADSRKRQLCLTASGDALFDTIAPQSEIAYRRIEMALGSEQVTQLNAMLTQLVNLELDQS